MPRTRSEIEAEIAALQAELATTQPDDLKITGVYRDKSVTFSKPGSGDRTSAFYINPTSLAGMGVVDAAPLRDWLNYHFPKENA